MKKKVLDIAHRGASLFTPENTKSSIMEAIRLGADVIELDIQMSKDKKLVVIHDSTIERTSDGDGRVDKMTLKKLKEFNFGTKLKREEILTLEEALKLVGKKCFVLVEIKETVTGYEKQVIAIINKVKNKENILVQAKSKGIIKKFREIDKEIKLGQILMTPLTNGRMLRRYQNFAKKYNLSFYAIWLSIYTFNNLPIKSSFRKIIKALDAVNVSSYVWTINDFVSMKHLINWGVDGIITNCPGVVERIINPKKMKVWESLRRIGK